MKFVLDSQAPAYIDDTNAASVASIVARFYDQWVRDGRPEELRMQPREVAYLQSNVPFLMRAKEVSLEQGDYEAAAKARDLERKARADLLRQQGICPECRRPLEESQA